MTWNIVIPTTFTMYAAMASRQLNPKAGKKAIIIGGTMPCELRVFIKELTWLLIEEILATSWLSAFWGPLTVHTESMHTDFLTPVRRWQANVCHSITACIEWKEASDGGS
jgi:hypothetical protein